MPSGFLVNTSSVEIAPTTVTKIIVATRAVIFSCGVKLQEISNTHFDVAQDNPSAAARDFVLAHPEFVLEQPARIFNESELTENISHWPGAWLRR